MDDEFRQANSDAAQARHAERRKTERGVMDAFGVSLSEARAALQARAAEELSTQRVERQPLPQSEPKEPAEIKVETTSFQPRPLVDASRQADAGAPEAKGVVVVGLDINGAPGTYKSVGFGFTLL